MGQDKETGDTAMVSQRNGEAAAAVVQCQCRGSGCPGCRPPAPYLCEACGSTDPFSHYDGCRETAGIPAQLDRVRIYPDPYHSALASPKPLDVKLRELQSNRKLQHRTFKRTSDGDIYTVLMFAHFGNYLVVVVQLCAIAQVKEVLPFDNFVLDFVQTETGKG
jgi:hypothetical protein